MKMINRVWVILFLVCFSLCDVVFAAKTILINTPVLNVRALPEGKKVGRVFEGQQFELRAEKDKWGQILFTLDQIGWIHLDYVQDLPVAPPKQSIVELCGHINQEFEKLGWHDDIQCRANDWQATAYSVEGRPLLYTVLGKSKVTSLLMCSVHSDENTPYQCFRLQHILAQNPRLLNRQQLVIVPLMNPDGFLGGQKTRTNAKGVDLNRNLPTSDWRQLALYMWKSRYRGDERRYPGSSANSEPENRFLISLVHRFTPDKIISIHSPMNFLDLDYMDNTNSDNEYIQGVHKNAKALALRFSQESQYVYRNYQTFPGSLGRYGDEWKIPIYTLELPTSNPKNAAKYFERFQNSLVKSFNVILGQEQTASQADPSSPLM